ncbi:SIS domain-containing protein [Luteibacter sp. CQ10]|uniref:SIS domain-containing protein n=1 Tax=Luteibacter sp. CQ10 TaxID=2805821 RepID=UPI0034A3A3A4
MTAQSQDLVPNLAALSAAAPERQRAAGYADTLREILQQPSTWRATAGSQGARHRALIQHMLASGVEHVVLTGSGSSVYVGDAVAPWLQAELGIPVRAIPAGDLLTHRAGVLARGPGLLVSIARSGDSPESVGAVDAVLAAAPTWRHLALTCNANGALATRYVDDARVDAIVLDERTNDRSLVMTSSFTNLMLAASQLTRSTPVAADGAAALAERVVDIYVDALAAMASNGGDTAVYLGTGCAFGVAREAALKMLEMTGGDTVTLAETFLGFRHGPMAWLSRGGTLVAFLSGDATVRAYETDLLRELDAKGLGASRVVVGEGIDPSLAGPSGLAIDLPGLYRLPPVQQGLLHAFVGQWLAFFRCLHLGHRPDTPSEGVLTRVVGTFALHGPEVGA